MCDVYPTFVDTPAIYHAGNYTGARLTFPPGALTPEKVADAIVKLARRPRDTTVLGAPESALRLGELANPVAASLMKRFMDHWSKKAAPARPTTGTMYAPPEGASGIRSGQQRGHQGGNTLLLLGAALAAAALGARLARSDGGRSA